MVHIGLDVDGIVADFFNPYVDFHNERYGTSFSVQDLYSHDLHTVFGLSFDAFLADVRTFFDTSSFRDIQPYAASLSLVPRLARTYTLRAVTARHVQTASDTAAFLQRYFNGCFHDIHHLHDSYDTKAIDSRNKGSLCKQLGIHLLVDDSAANICSALKHGIQAVLVERPWNIREAIPADVECVPLEDLESAITRTLSRNGHTLS